LFARALIYALYLIFSVGQAFSPSSIPTSFSIPPGSAAPLCYLKTLFSGKTASFANLFYATFPFPISSFLQIDLHGSNTFTLGVVNHLLIEWHLYLACCFVVLRSQENTKDEVKEALLRES